MDTRNLPLADLIDPPILLRAVDKKAVEYLELRDDIAQHGLHNSICVRPSKAFPGKYEVVDGRTRVTAAREAGLTEIPAVIKEMTDSELMLVQLSANEHRLKTSTADIAHQIRRVMKEQPGMTQSDLSALLHKSPTWVRRMLSIGRIALDKVYRDALDHGTLTIEAAYWLSRLRRDQWPEYFMEARVLKIAEFRALVQAELRQLRSDAKTRQREKAFVGDSDLRPRLRRLAELMPEIDNLDVGLLTLSDQQDPKSALQGWAKALLWAVHLDADSVERFHARMRRRFKNKLTRRSRELGQ